MKRCSKCKVEKPLEEFGKDKHAFDGKAYQCRACRAIQRKVYYAKAKGMILAQQREYIAANRSLHKARRSRYYAANRDAINAKHAAYRAADPSRYAKYSLKVRLSKTFNVVPEAMVEVRHLINRIKSFNRERKEQ